MRPPAAGPGVGEGARGAGWGGGARAAPARSRPCTHARTRTHSRAQTHFPSLRSFYLSFLPVRFLARSPRPSPSCSLLSSPSPFSYFWSQALSLWISFISALPFSSLLLPLLPPSLLLLTSTLPLQPSPYLPPRARTHSLERRWKETKEKKGSRAKAKRVTSVTIAGAGAETAGPLPTSASLPFYIRILGPGLPNYAVAWGGGAWAEDKPLPHQGPPLG